ncbi:metal transporter [Pseudonocardia sp. CNS-004]|nr:metal transporter [Pseudonocardia sp. CNS-004]
MTAPATQRSAWAIGVAAVLAIAAALVALAMLGGRALPERPGPPVETLAVERTLLSPGEITLTLRNTGPDPVQVAQVNVNDSFVDFAGPTEPIERLGTAQLHLNYPWADGQPYLISLLTSTGVVIEHEIPAAVQTPPAGAGLLGLMTLLGTYVGVIPVVLGMLFLPVLRRASRTLVRAVLGLTVGLLAFLAVDAAIEGFELADGSGGAFGGGTLVVLGAGLAFLALAGVDRAVHARTSGAGEATGVRLAVLIAIGIGLHNLGEGLAIGSAYAVGELALGAALVVGFALHNTTEGIAIVAPLARDRPRLLTLLGMGLLAGAPAIVGTIIGASVDNAALAAFLFGVGVGAIGQVILQITPGLRGAAGRALDAPAIGGVAAGIVVMYLTGLFVVA